ncbi:dna topoisomerase i [Nannochloropsis gaditana]|uniref:Dna topoisomerase i n=1 Tax=Nannochloropsis gaditana TaxID=72520 RepID=W7TSA5_9STRA|nr:dna topoisomerase i [Nannochloropsis gaditana]
MDGPLPGRMTCRRKRSTAWAPLPLLLAPLFSTVARSQALFTSTAFVRPLVPVSPSMFRILLRRQHDVTTHIFPSLHHQRHRLLPPASVVRLATAQSTTSTTSTRRKSTTSSKAGSKAKTSAGASKKKVNGGKSRSAEGTGDEPGLSSGTNLIIVESATKANTIKRFLTGGKGGDKWEVDFCMGHVRELPRTLADMPPTAKKEKSKVLGVKIDQDYEPVWIVLPGRESVVSRLKEKAKTCSALYLATDEDREGEAISWHLLDLLQPRVPVHRVIFHEITPTAVGAGLASPRPLDIALVEAQHARRVLDRVAGYTMSPLLWKKIARGLSAGRVQSAGLKLLVDRERERMTFQSAAYAGLRATLVVGGREEGGRDRRPVADTGWTAAGHQQ